MASLPNIRSFDAVTEVVALNPGFAATLLPAQADPMIPVDGATLGVASMTQSAPHNGECHHDGDEVLYVISGQVKVRFPDGEFASMALHPGDGCIVPASIWHCVDVVSPCQILYVTPGPNNEWRE